MPNCPICDTILAGEYPIGLTAPVHNCRRCGPWVELGSAGRPVMPLETELGGWDLRGRRRRSMLSHLIRKMQRADGGPVGVPPDLGIWALDDPLPPPSDQLASLIIWIGDNQPSPVEDALIDRDALDAWIGGIVVRESPGQAILWLAATQTVKDFLQIKGDPAGGQWYLRLSMAGWDRYGELKLSRADSRLAFMAMKFGYPDLDQIVDTWFRPAVDEAGFDLRTLPDQQPAGCIDDQLRAALHTCRFVVADLTHGSFGAYWEAGFAEGLGRPVIYTCRRAEWEAQSSHFDTNHLVTVVWDPGNPADAATRLKATIRATLPAEAVLADPPPA